MAKVSMAKAAQMFAVSRPTLLKDLKKGKISGEKTTEGKSTSWQIDVSELARVYLRREDVSPPEHAGLTTDGTPAAPDLQAEIRVLQAKLEAAEKLAEERARHLADLRALLPGQEDRSPRRTWWPWSR